ncbi:MAG: hypothetical protein M0Z67_04880 [Nitrospiraceae bacterium]|nr:hypothetical protein [Nitrospiraceae bacterium]
MKNSLRIIVFLFVVFISFSTAFSATWNGGGSDELASTPENWTGTVLPSPGDSIIFNSTSSKDCTWDLAETYTALAIDGGYAGTVTIDSTSTLTLSGSYVPPAAPSGLNAVAISSSSIDLSWTDNSSGEQCFKIERKTGDTGTYSQIGTVGAEATAYSDTGPSLLPGTIYYYRVRAYDIFSDSSYSNEANATTAAVAPSATTNAVSNNVGTSATLNATVNPGGAETSVHFEWGTTTSYGNTTPTQIIPAGTGDVAVTANIIGLAANTPYHVRIVATNSVGTTNGSDVPFTTPIIAPSATTNAVSNNTAGNSATFSAQLLPAGYDDISVAANIIGLSINMTYHFRVVATNTDGTSYGPDMTFTTPPITITITSPTDGSTIYRPDIMVKGILVTPGNETGVTVNGKVAMVYNNQFVANHVPLTDGANTIFVTATDTAGNTATTAIAITADTSYPYVTLTANVESGVSPLTVNFSASTAIPNAVETYQADFDGNATIDYSGPTFDNVSNLYSSPGIFFATLGVADIAQTTYTDTIAIVPVDGNNYDAMLKGIWNSMKGRLQVQDVAGASNYYSAVSKAKYSGIFSALVSNLPEIVANMQDISLNYIGSDVAEYRIIRNETVNGKPTDVMYFIYFVKDEDGLWKIQGF